MSSATEYLEWHEKDIFEMSMDDILDLWSEYGVSVREAVENDYMCIDSDPYYAEIRERMTADGINKVPVYVEDGDPDWGIEPALINGHHRVKIAYDLGFTTMRATREGRVSGWALELERVVI